ncbi:MAG: hypothetical protein VKJ05_08000 [Synechococcaceae cyanobacterium]|nr:hypothetical protein [Synechococcaceae cyanobacterium]
MAWDPTVLRKYNNTGHFRLLNQVRSELKTNPLLRPKEGESVAVVNRSRSLTRALENRPQGIAPARARRSAAAYPSVTVVAALPGSGEGEAPQPYGSSSNASFRDRLNQIDMR